jgi:prostamide/prostaglandin F2alpha synthase
VHCRDHAVQLHRAREQFEQAGVKLVLIGQATPRHAKHFRDRLKLEPLPVLADERRETYKLAGFRRGSANQVIGPKSVISGLRHSARSGVLQGRVIGDPMQLGGAMIVLPGGTVAFEQAQQHAGDTIPPEQLLQAARAAAAAA